MSERLAGALRTTVLDPSGAAREAIVVRVTDETGATGWGEASPLPGYSPDTLDDVEAGLDEWALRWARGEERSERAPDARPGAVDPTPDPDILASLPAARCAVDVALLDLEGRRRGVPIHRLLVETVPAVRPVERVPVAALVVLAGISRPGAPPSGSPSQSLHDVADRVAEGYRTVKLKLGTDDDSDEGFAASLAQLEAIRAAFPYLKLRLDVNGRWSPESARARIAVLKQRIDPELVEQPVGAEELPGFGGVAVPLAADESLRVPGALEELAAPGGCAFLVLKPMVLGGLTACQAIAAEGFSHGMQPIVSHTFGGAMAHAAACELALALAAADPVSGPPAAGLAGHDDLPQRAGTWIAAAEIDGHGVEAPW